MDKPIINCVTLTNGRCGLTTETKAEALRRIGTDNVRSFEPATEEQVAWIRGMGGRVPTNGRIKRTRK